MDCADRDLHRDDGFQDMASQLRDDQYYFRSQKTVVNGGNWW